MKISPQLKGAIQRCISTIFSWDKLYEFGTSIGVETKIIREKRKNGGPNFDPYCTKKRAAAYIMDNTSDDEVEIVLETLVAMSKKAKWDKDYSDKVIEEMNEILKRTMSIQINDKGKIVPLFDELKDIPSRIPQKLRDIGFENEADDYEKAYRSYEQNDKGSIATIRTVLEGVSESILSSKGINVTNQMDRFIKLQSIGVLRDIDTKQCKICGFRKKDLELIDAYNIYSLLSHYGNHTGELTV